MNFCGWCFHYVTSFFEGNGLFIKSYINLHQRGTLDLMLLGISLLLLLAPDISTSSCFVLVVIGQLHFLIPCHVHPLWKEENFPRAPNVDFFIATHRVISQEVMMLGGKSWNWQIPARHCWRLVLSCQVIWTSQTLSVLKSCSAHYMALHTWKRNRYKYINKSSQF